MSDTQLASQVAELQKRLEALEARKPTPGPRGPAGDISAAVGNAEAVAKAIVIDRLDEYVKRTEAIADRVQWQIDSANRHIRAEFQNIVNSAVSAALRDALQEQGALENKMLVLLQEYGLLDERNVPYAGPQSKYQDSAIKTD